MRLILITIFISVQFSLCLAQDGSDINYVKPENLNKSYIGRIVQIDFYRRSFGGKDIDKVLIDFDDKQLEFVEHREDDGFNNWFFQQYLESVDNVGGKKIKIKEFKLVDIKEEGISVLAYFSEKPFTRELSFKKSQIAEFLFKAK